MTDLLPLYGHRFDNEIVLPAQFFGAAGAPLSPFHKLLRAVLQDAWECATTPLRPRPGSTHGHLPSQRLIQTEARAWIRSDDATHTYAFVNVCAHLGLDPDAIRRALARAIAHEIPERPRIVDLRPSVPGEKWRERHTLVAIPAHIVGAKDGCYLLKLADNTRVPVLKSALRPGGVRHVGDIGTALVTRYTARRRGLLPYATPVPTQHSSLSTQD